MDIDKAVAKTMINILVKAKKKGLSFDDLIKMLRDTFETNK